MIFERETILRLRRYAQQEKSRWGYRGEMKPGFILACERQKRGIAWNPFSVGPCPADEGLELWSKKYQEQTFNAAERWRKNTFHKLDIEKGCVIMAVLFPDDRFNKEFESQLYHWWVTQREFMLGEFECIRV